MLYYIWPQEAQWREPSDSRATIYGAIVTVYRGGVADGFGFSNSHVLCSSRNSKVVI